MTVRFAAAPMARSGRRSNPATLYGAVVIWQVINDDRRYADRRLTRQFAEPIALSRHFDGCASSLAGASRLETQHAAGAPDRRQRIQPATASTTVGACRGVPRPRVFATIQSYFATASASLSMRVEIVWGRLDSRWAWTGGG